MTFGVPDPDLVRLLLPGTGAQGHRSGRQAGRLLVAIILTYTAIGVLTVTLAWA